MNLEEIKQLIDLANESGVAELEVQRGENRVRIRRAGLVVQDIALGGDSRGFGGQPASSFGGANPSLSGSSPSAAPPSAAPTEDPNLVIVKSPIVGTYYEAAAPDSDPFVAIGDSVRPGQVLCIIESMKLMNEIECEHSGVIVNLLAENGQPVEYGEPLMTIRAH